MANKDAPSNPSRRNFIKHVSTGIVSAYAATPVVKANTQNIKQEIIDSIEGKIELRLRVNNKKVSAKINPNKTLAEFLRDDLNLTGTKIVCNQGECGSCTVLLNDQPVYSCHLLALDADGSNVLTIEGLLEGNELHQIQQSFIDEDGLQCGFCTPGQIISGYSALKQNPTASDDEIKKAMSGNLCRCGAYPKIFDSVKTTLNKKI